MAISYYSGGADTSIIQRGLSRARIARAFHIVHGSMEISSRSGRSHFTPSIHAPANQQVQSARERREDFPCFYWLKRGSNGDAFRLEP